MESPVENERIATRPPKRRWLQFGLRTMLGLVAVAAVLLALIVVPAERQRRAVEALRSLGGSVFYVGDYEAATAISPPSPAWIERVLGPDFARTPAEISLSGEHVDDDALGNVRGMLGLRSLYLVDTKISDAGLSHLAGLTALEELDLSGTHVTDAGLLRLQGLSGLQVLYLQNTQVSDVGLVHLERLTGLTQLYLGQTQVSESGLTKLRAALPGCKIDWQ